MERKSDIQGRSRRPVEGGDEGVGHGTYFFSVHSTIGRDLQNDGTHARERRWKGQERQSPIPATPLLTTGGRARYSGVSNRLPSVGGARRGYCNGDKRTSESRWKETNSETTSASWTDRR